MKKWILPTVCIGVMTCGSWAAAQQSNDTNQRQAAPAQAGQQDQGPQARQGQARRGNAQQVEQLAGWLAMCNHVEVEISRLATERANNVKVKQFAERMVEAHTKYQGKLKQFMPQADSQEDAAVDPQPDAQAATAKRRQANRNHGALMQVGIQTSKNKLALTKQMLEKYEGQDFDMGYLGQQIIAHIDMLATLHAMEKRGTPEFQQVVKQAIQDTEGHLKQAHSIAMQLEDKEGGGRTARDQ
jgi:predicted outer membrane protein